MAAKTPRLKNPPLGAYDSIWGILAEQHLSAISTYLRLACMQRMDRTAFLVAIAEVEFAEVAGVILRKRRDEMVSRAGEWLAHPDDFAGEIDATIKYFQLKWKPLNLAQKHLLLEYCRRAVEATYGKNAQA